ncbi:hypothetical protein EV356DRAFT_457226 [Viridothelium virens]|uniref:Rhodopsin domain-containing protein n=1 Tax=Viridothelium virens TaxID=1048519 RepID=A0A6A6GT07_VIRVR|nr:hypothetical protein EV356DRAFT_457226 [Viridothelium virens]
MTELNPPSTNIHDVRSPPASHVVIPIAVAATISVIARIYSRRLKKFPLAAHDYLILVGLVLAWSCAVIIIEMERYGLGRHIEVVPPPSIPKFLKTMWAGTMLFHTTTTVIKASIIMFFLQIFPVRHIAVMVYFIAVIVFLSWAILVPMDFFLCIPLRALWDRSISGKCLDIGRYYMATTISNTITDFALLAIPIIQIWNLRIAWTRKASVSGIFAVGAFVCAAGIVRLVYPFLQWGDITWVLYNDYVWASIEASTGIICACIPTMRPAAEVVIINPARDLISRLRNRSRILMKHESDPSRHPGVDISSRAFRRLPDTQRSSWQAVVNTRGTSTIIIQTGDKPDENENPTLSAKINVRRDINVESNDV